MRALFKHDRLSQSSTKSPTNDLNSFNAEDLYQKVIIIIQVNVKSNHRKYKGQLVLY